MFSGGSRYSKSNSLRAPSRSRNGGRSRRCFSKILRGFPYRLVPPSGRPCLMGWPLVLGFRLLSVPEVAVVPISSSGGESMPRRHKRSRAPEPSAMGRRTHSPGAASPSFVWLSLSLCNREYISCKYRNENKNSKISYIEFKSDNGGLTEESAGKETRTFSLRNHRSPRDIT